MKKIITFAIISLAAAVQAASVEQVIVRQQWPWSTDIKVEYKLADVTNAQDITVRAFDGSTELDRTKLRKAITGSLYGVSNKVGSFTIDPVAAFGTAKPTIDNLRIKIEVADSAPEMTEIIYKVVNLDTDPVTITDLCRADFYNGKIDPQYSGITTNYMEFRSYSSYVQKPPFDDVFIWSGVTNGDLYRTSKIALRKIPAAGQSYQMGTYSKDGSTKRTVSFSTNFWMGVFPITQAQMKYFRPTYVAYETNELYAATRVATAVTWDAARSASGQTWPSGTHANVGANSFIGKLQAATGNKRFDLPTSAQWEFGARAGATGMFPHYSPGAQWYFYAGCFIRRGNEVPSDRNCDLSAGSLPPGQCVPNGWGLYDVLGIVWEHCLDQSGDPLPEGLDPRGPDNSSSSRVCRGGGYGYEAYDLGSRWAQPTWYNTSYLGFRLCLHEED